MTNNQRSDQEDINSIDCSNLFINEKMNQIILEESPSRSNSPEMNMEEIYEWDIEEEYIKDMIHRLRPLDLVLFSGNSIVSKTICLMEKGKLGLGTISHVGIIVSSDVLPHIKELKPGKFYIWESTSKKQTLFRKGLKDIYGKNRFGVQIRELESVVYDYLKFQGRVFWGKLINNPWKKYLHQNNICKCCSEGLCLTYKECIICMLKELEKKYGKSRFNLSIIDLAASIYPSIRPLRRLKKKISSLFKKKNKSYVPLFCSEFVAIIYKGLQILGDHVQPSDVVPVDFLGVNEDGIPRLIKKIVEFKDDKIDPNL
jgi:hypothetical protein